VATFRRGVVHQITSESGVVLLDNEYGSPEEDARRRDITINGLFYDIATHSIIDYVGGVQDLDDRIIRTINDPDLSFVEDPVRMIRTLRHAARTAFHVEENTLRATYRNRSELQKANTSRLMEEMFKDLRGGAVEPFFKSMVETHLLDVIMPALAAQLREVGLDHPLWRRFRALDRWSQEGRETSNPVLLALFLHTVLLPEAEAWTGERGQQMDVWRTLMRNFTETSRHMRISRRDAERVAQVLISFRKLVQAYRRGHLTPIFQKKPYLADALDFLEVEFSSRGEPVELIAQWRKEFVGERPGRPSRLPFGAGGFLGGRGGRGRRGRGHLEGGGPPGGETEEMEGGEEIAGEMSGELGAAGGPHGTATEGPGTATGGRAAGGTVTGGTAGGGGEPGGERRRRRRRRGGRRRKSRHRGD
jgi:poly(A) polymerase